MDDDACATCCGTATGRDTPQISNRTRHLSNASQSMALCLETCTLHDVCARVQFSKPSHVTQMFLAFSALRSLVRSASPAAQVAGFRRKGFIFLTAIAATCRRKTRKNSRIKTFVVNTIAATARTGMLAHVVTHVQQRPTLKSCKRGTYSTELIGNAHKAQPQALPDPRTQYIPRHQGMCTRTTIVKLR